MNHLIERGDARIADIFRRLGRTEKLLGELETPSHRTLNGHRFLNDGELAERLRVSRRTLQEYRAAGVLPYYLICGKVLYSESEVQQYLENRRKRSIEEQELL